MEHPTPDTPTTCYCAAKHDGYLCTERPGHSGDHVAAGVDGTVYRRWSQSPSEPPNPCALEDVPDGAEWSHSDDAADEFWRTGPAVGLDPRGAVWWRWPERLSDDDIVMVPVLRKDCREAARRVGGLGQTAPSRQTYEAMAAAAENPAAEETP